MQNRGGEDAGKNDTVLYNHPGKHAGPGANMYAILYDYEIQADDAPGITLIEVL